MPTAEIIPFGAPVPPAPLHPPSILPLPALAPVFAPVPLARSRSDIGMAEIARRLRWDGYRPVTIVAKLRALNAYSGFPAPKNPRIVKGHPVPGPRAIVQRSLWDRGEVDDWFDNRDPPATVAARRAAQRDQLRSDLAQRAQDIGQRIAANAARRRAVG